MKYTTDEERRLARNASRMRHYYAHREETLAKNREYYQANPEKCRAAVKRWEQEHPGYWRRYAEKNNARRREKYATDEDYRARKLAACKKCRDNASPEWKAKERERKRRWAAEHPEVIRRNFAAWKARQKDNETD